MNKEKIKEDVCQIILKFLPHLKNEDFYNKNFTELDADSLDMVEIIMKVENDFSIEIDDETAENLTTAEKIVEFLDSKLNR